MPKADFKVTLQFRGYPVPEQVIEEEDVRASWLNDFRRAVVQHAQSSGMCSDWSEAFRGDEAQAHDLVLAVEEVHAFTVTIRPRLTAQVTVNGGRNVSDAVDALDSMLRNDINWSDVEGVDYLGETDVEVFIDHYGSYMSTDDVPSQFNEVEVG
jgi:hypothetical protein